MCLQGIIFTTEFTTKGSLHTGQSIVGSLSAVIVTSSSDSIEDLGAGSDRGLAASEVVVRW